MPFSKTISIYWDFFSRAGIFFVMVQKNAGLYIVQLIREFLLPISTSGYEITKQTSLLVTALHTFSTPIPKIMNLLMKDR